MADEVAPLAAWSIAAVPALTPAALYAEGDGPVLLEALVSTIKADIAAVPADMSTGVSRAKFSSLAYKIARSKTAVDEAGAALIEDHNKVVARVNKQRREFRALFDELRDAARKPLDEWEAAEKARLELLGAEKEKLRKAAVVLAAETADEVKARLRTTKAYNFEASLWGEDVEIGRALQRTAVEALDAAHKRLVQQEADKAELDKLRAEQAQRDAAAAEEQRKRDAEAAEEQRKKDAAAAAEAEAERLEAARKAAVEAERQRAAREAEDKRLAEQAEERRRAENTRIRNATTKAIREALVALGGAEAPLTERQAAVVADAIVAGKLPKVRVEF